VRAPIPKAGHLPGVAAARPTPPPPHPTAPHPTPPLPAACARPSWCHDRAHDAPAAGDNLLSLQGQKSAVPGPEHLAAPPGLPAPGAAEGPGGRAVSWPSRCRWGSAVRRSGQQQQQRWQQPGQQLQPGARWRRKGPLRRALLGGASSLGPPSVALAGCAGQQAAGRWAVCSAVAGGWVHDELAAGRAGQAGPGRMQGGQHGTRPQTMQVSKLIQTGRGRLLRLPCAAHADGVPASGQSVLAIPPRRRIAAPARQAARATLPTASTPRPRVAPAPDLPRERVLHSGSISSAAPRLGRPSFQTRGRNTQPRNRAHAASPRARAPPSVAHGLGGALSRPARRSAAHHETAARVTRPSESRLARAAPPAPPQP
jgi:hypothetical protein